MSEWDIVDLFGAVGGGLLDEVYFGCGVVENACDYVVILKCEELHFAVQVL